MKEEISRPHTIKELLDAMAIFGDRLAITDSSTGASLTYGQLHERIIDFAKKLPLSVVSGSRIILYDLAPFDWIPVFFAAIARGCIIVPLDVRVSSEFIDSVITLTESSLVIVGDNTHIATSVDVLKITALKSNSSIFLEQKLFETSDSDPREILFTSGTWARPKGVILSEKNIMTNARQILSTFSHSADNVSLAVLPLSHAYQQTAGLFVPLMVGARIVFLTTLNGKSLSNALSEYAVDTMLVVPRVLSLIESGVLRNFGSHSVRRKFAYIIRLCRHIPFFLRRFLLSPIRKKIGKNLKTLVVGGAPLPLSLDHFFQGLGFQVIVGYGASECAPVISISLDQKRRAGDVGVPIEGVDVKINADSELIVSGDSVYLGYWPEISRPHSFNTEDVGAIGVDGRLLLKGRTKNLIVYPTGDKIFCEDIEHIAGQFPHVEDSCVISFETGGTIKLYCALKGNILLKGEEERLKNLINQRLPFGVQLEKILYLDQSEFPYTHTLKPNRKKIKEIFSTIAGASPQD